MLAGFLFPKRYNSLMYELRNYQHFTDVLPKNLGDRPLLDQNEYLNLGWLNAHKGHDWRHSFRKAPGVARMGFFGGSTTTSGGKSV